MTGNGSTSYVYDAENRLIATGGYSYIYDGDGADEITVSAPRGRVDLEALKRPRLGGKEPSDDDYRL